MKRKEGSARNKNRKNRKYIANIGHRIRFRIPNEPDKILSEYFYGTTSRVISRLPVDR